MNAVFGLRGGAWTLVRVSAVLWVRLVKNVEVVEAGVALHERTVWVPKMPSKGLTLPVRIRGSDHRVCPFFVVGRGLDRRSAPDLSPPLVEPAAQERDADGGRCSGRRSRPARAPDDGDRRS